MRKIYNASILAGLLLGALCITSCNKADDDVARVIPEKPVPVITGTKGIYMLCEGLWNDNNSAISYYDIEKKTSVKDYFQKVNGRKLGETANDLQAYGSKMYCVVSGTQGKPQSFLEIMDIASGKVLKTISFNSATDGYMPRYVAFYKNKAYVSRYDGIVSRIDTASMEIDKELQLMNGANKNSGLEGLAVSNGKLYVTNSTHPYYPTGAKDKVSVIDLATFTNTKNISVGFNPVKIAANGNGDLMVVTWGNYGNIPASVQNINAFTDEVTATYPYNADPIAVSKNKAYFFSEYNGPVQVFNISRGVMMYDFVSDGTVFNTVYGITVNDFDQTVAIADANNYNGNSGMAYGFDKNGKKIYSFETAGLPQHAVFVYNYKLP